MEKDYRKLVEELAGRLAMYNGRPIKFMEVCGTHTMSVFKHGIRGLLPKNIKLISGPGCPVCVTPQGYVDQAIEIAQNGAIVVTFGDMMRVPGTSTSLEKVKALGKDVRVVYSPLDCIKIAQDNPDKKVVFLAVGFETTSPVIALAVKKAKEMGINNFYVLCSMKLIIPALHALCQDEANEIDGFLMPGHVSAVLGHNCYNFLAEEYKKACVVGGFEAHEILLALVMMVEQIENGQYVIENAYKSIVSESGNTKAYSIIFEVFEPEDSLWRGIGAIGGSGLKLRGEYEAFDARKEFGLGEMYESTPKGCRCGDVIKGNVLPHECPLFDKVCTTLNPVGACMVSSEGTCAAYYKYAR